MDENGCSPNDLTSNTIIRGLLQHSETSRVMKYLHMIVEKGFLANTTTTTMFINFLSSNQVDENIKELLKKYTGRLLSCSTSTTIFTLLSITSQSVSNLYVL